LVLSCLTQNNFKQLQVSVVKVCQMGPYYNMFCLEPLVSILDYC
jgi:hypothetical protein